MVASLDELMERRRQYAEIGEAFEAEGMDDVAAEFAAVINLVNLFDRRVTARLNRLREVAHAMEWHVSGDYGRDQLEQAVNKLRAGSE